MNTKLEDEYTRYEVARILGARSLQLAMDAPVLLKLSPEEEEELNYDVMKIAEKELESGVLPITVKRPLPKKSEKEIKKLTNKEIREQLGKKAEQDEKEMKKLEEKKKEIEKQDEKEIEEEGEIMKIANPDDEEDELEEEEDSKEI